MNDRLKLAIAAGLLATFGLTGCQKAEQEDTAAGMETAAATEAATVETTAPVTLGSGIDLSGFDTSVRPQDDFFDYVNGKWVAETELPADRARWGTFDALREKSQEDVRTLMPRSRLSGSM